jgi:glutamate dehydrogenase (NADP+)
VKKSLVGGNVHGSYNAKEHNERWKKSPLFARLGQPLLFDSGVEASELLATEARRRDPYQSDFLQAIDEVSQDIAPTIDRHPRYAWVFKQLMEPERLVTFRVPWQDDDGNARINRGYRVQYSSALGPFHGGLRFHTSMSHG